MLAGVMGAEARKSGNKKEEGKKSLQRLDLKRAQQPKALSLIGRRWVPATFRREIKPQSFKSFFPFSPSLFFRKLVKHPQKFLPNFPLVRGW